MTGRNGLERLQEKRLDARMEYGHLVTAYLALANMMWVGFGAFFTINTLLATGLSFSYTTSATAIPQKFLHILHVAFPVTGACMSVIAVYAAILISNVRKRTRDRGVELENLLSARMFTSMHPRSGSFPFATAIGSFCFFVIWGTVLFSVINPFG
jgi:hypothetical protein